MENYSMDGNKNTLPHLLLKTISEKENLNFVGHFENEKLVFISRKDYGAIIENLTLALISKDFKKHDKLCIIGNTCREWHFFDIATMCCGGVVVPIYPTITPADTEFIINHSEGSVIVIENDEIASKIISIADKLPNLRLVITLKKLNDTNFKQLNERFKVCEYNELLKFGANYAAENPDLFNIRCKEIHKDDIATIIYTSGTTGQPKGAVIHHGAVYAMLENIEHFAHNAFTPEDRTLCFLPLSHVFGRCESLMPIKFGWQIVYAEAMDKVLDNISIAKPTVLCAVPRVLEKVYDKVMLKVESSGAITKSLFSWANDIATKYHDLIDADKTPATSISLQYQLAQKLVFDKIYDSFGGRVRYFISGGAPLSVQIIKFLRNARLTVLEGYGLTETVAPCVINPLSKQIPGTVGRPLSDVQVKFRGEGEILIKSQAMLSEYFKSPEQTAAAFTEDGFFCTGDVGRFTTEGYLEITGRIKDIIITSGGKNIAPQKIEEIISRSQLFDTVTCYGNDQKYLIALISLNAVYASKLSKNSGENLQNLVNDPDVISAVQKEIEVYNEELAPFETIKKFLLIPEEFSPANFLTPSLKVKKKLLFEKYQAQIDALYI